MIPQASNQENARYTWEDYRRWSGDERWEIVDGRAYAMTPAPSTRHQGIVGHLFSRFHRQLSGKGCTPFTAPTDVRLSETDVVQPDILVVCDPARILPTHVEGAPDVVVEVLSPATATRDLRLKKALYERCGVREYIVVDPLENYAIRFLLGADGYDKGSVFGADERLVVAVLEEMEIPLWEVFEVPGPEEAS